MKRILITLTALWVLAVSCQKENDFVTRPVATERPFKVFTRNATAYVSLPTDSARVSVTNDLPNGSWAGLSISWRKITGPGSQTLHEPNNPYCLITGLQEGTYSFEVSVAAQDGFVARDTQYVFVGKLSANPKEINLGTYTWDDSGPIGFNHIFIKDFVSLLQSNGLNSSTYFEVFIRTRLTKGWERVDNEKTYTLQSRYTYLYWNDNFQLEDWTTQHKVGESSAILLRYD